MPRHVSSAALFSGILCLFVLGSGTARARPNPLRSDADVGIYLNGMAGNVLGLRHFPDVGFTAEVGFLSFDGAQRSGFSTPGVGGGVVLGDLTIGTRLEAGLHHDNPDEPADDTNVGWLGVVPTLQYYLDGEDLAPFLGGQFGPTLLFPDGGDAQVWLEAGVLGGLAVFFGDSFSVEPQGQFNFVYDSSTERAGYEIMLTVDLRGWIGESTDTPGPEEEPVFSSEPEPAPPPADPEGGFE